jgi:hypothetical protein
MNVLYVNGFGGSRGLVERALFDAARGGPHYLYTVRWPSGDLREMRARAVVDVARKVAEARSLPRGLVQAALEGTRRASEAWEQALANVPAGAAQLAAVLEDTRSTGAPTSLIAFSLGCRVVLHAIATGLVEPEALERLVFVGSAAPVADFGALSEGIAGGLRVVHVYSRKDAVLDRLYPLGAAGAPPSGRDALEIEGIENVKVDVGHRGYASIANSLWALAVGERLLSAPPAEE